MIREQLASILGDRSEAGRHLDGVAKGIRKDISDLREKGQTDDHGEPISEKELAKRQIHAAVLEERLNKALGSGETVFAVVSS